MTSTLDSISKLHANVARFADTHLRPSDGDFVLIVYTDECRMYAAALQILLRALGCEVVCERMAAGFDPDFSQRLQPVLPERLSSRRQMLVVTLETWSLSHSQVFRDIVIRYGAESVRTFRLANVGERLFDEGLAMPPDEMIRRNATLLLELKQDSSVRVTSDAGTDLEIHFDHELYEWMSIRGACKVGGFTALPAGEIASYPSLIRGVLVGNGALHPNIKVDFDVRLEDTPLTIEIEDSLAVRFTCANEEIAEVTGRMFDEPHGRRVGEVGFGTNIGLRGFTADNSHLNERFPGLHLGFGRHNQSLALVPYLSQLHLDVIMQGGLVRDRSSNGPDIDLSTFVTDESAVHPACDRDEDLDDCCSGP